MTSNQRREELAKLAKRVQSGIFEMLKIVVELLADHKYVDANGGEEKLMADLSEKEFSHFGGSPSLTAMLRAYRENPVRSVWAEHRFNVWAMIDLANPKPSASDAEARVNWKQRCKELEEEVEKLKQRVAELEGNVAAEISRHDQTRSSLSKLERENGELTGALRQMEKVKGVSSAAAAVSGF